MPGWAGWRVSEAVDRTQRSCRISNREEKSKTVSMCITEKYWARLRTSFICLTNDIMDNVMLTSKVRSSQWSWVQLQWHPLANVYEFISCGVSLPSHWTPYLHALYLWCQPSTLLCLHAAFSFKSVVFPEISLDERKRYWVIGHPVISIWHHRASTALTAEGLASQELNARWFEYRWGQWSDGICK